MSLSLRDELRLVIHRDRILAVRIARTLTLKGISHRIAEKKEYGGRADASPDELLGLLETVLSGLAAKPAYARVVLSSHFMSYAMVELDGALNGEAEELAYVRHFFAQQYGEHAEALEFRVDREDAGAQRLVSGVDALFLQNIRAAFARASIRLRSLRPYLMAAFNSCHVHFQGQDAWFVLHEEGSLCIGFVGNGRLRSIRSMGVGEDWSGKLTELLDRESYLSEMDVASNRVYLCAPGQSGTEIAGGAHWKVHRLAPQHSADLTDGYDEQFAMAICG